MQTTVATDNFSTEDREFDRRGRLVQLSRPALVTVTMGDPARRLGCRILKARFCSTVGLAFARGVDTAVGSPMA